MFYFILSFQFSSIETVLKERGYFTTLGLERRNWLHLKELKVVLNWNSYTSRKVFSMIEYIQEVFCKEMKALYLKRAFTFIGFS